MSLSMGWKVFIALAVITVVFYVYFSDRYENPTWVKNPDNSTSPKCAENKGYILKQDPNNTSKLTCYKESGLGHVKMTFLQALSESLWVGVGFVFFLEYLRRDRSSAVLFYEDKIQKENRPITICPDVFRENGYIWTWKGFDAIVTGYEDELFIAKEKTVSKIETNLLFKGERYELSPLQLFEYLEKNANLFLKITGRDINDFIGKGVIEKTEGMPKIYCPKPLSYERLKAFHSLKGNYMFGSDRFDAVIEMLFKEKHSIGDLDKEMHESMNRITKKGEDYCAANARTARQADSTRKTETGESARSNPQPNSAETRREA